MGTKNDMATRIARLIAKHTYYVDQGMGHGHYAIRIEQLDLIELVRLLYKGGFLAIDGPGKKGVPAKKKEEELSLLSMMLSDGEHGVETYDDDQGYGVTLCGKPIGRNDVDPREEPITCTHCKQTLTKKPKNEGAKA